MNANRFDKVAKIFASRRLSRRRALSRGAAGLAAGAVAAAGLLGASAQHATPPPEPPVAGRGPTMLFLQSFRSGTIVPKAGADGRYTVTLEQGLGQTIYFSDRPDRLVGAAPTAAFLEGLGFPEDNPPNAALVVETAPGETDIAVVELFDPVFDPAGARRDLRRRRPGQLGGRRWRWGSRRRRPTWPALAPRFGSAHLFIDDCPGISISCRIEGDVVGSFNAGPCRKTCWDPFWNRCDSCTKNEVMDAYWTDQCNKKLSACNGRCIRGEPCSVVSWTGRCSPY